VKIALAQINVTVGDFTGNSEKIIRYALEARERNADVVLFPELSVCGYPPRDLVEKNSFVTRNREVVEEIARKTVGITAVVGFVTPAHEETGKSVMNSAAVLRDGKVVAIQSKRLLPTYDVFDEMRNFAPAAKQQVIEMDGVPAALTICEDAWNDKTYWNRRLYSSDPVEDLIGQGGKIVLNISASPFHVGKRELRCDIVRAIAKHHRLPVALVNQVGGNDQLVFDGSSVVFAPDGRTVAQAKSFEEDLIVFDSETLTGDVHDQIQGSTETAYAALVLGTRDYVRKCGFKKVIIGLSGGIDSALTAVIAVDALGKENVIGVGMPSEFSSEGSITDARDLADNLGIRFDVVPIKEIFHEYRSALKTVFAGLKEDVTEENLQARIRGTLLMAFSNKFGALVLTTGNKSELGVGYCTLYGDMVGGLAVISDVPKTMVYRLCEYINSDRELIPESTMTKPPSAELRPGQKDSDSLPPYEVLDKILEDYVEDSKSAREIAEARGFDETLVRRVIKLIEQSEYKRQQAAPGIKISEKAFGVGRRFPIAAKYEV
jgi:NAD+ synthase (glutamine-hydrolysing)